MKKYEKTHSWISFRVDFSNATPNLWMKLGEAQSKSDHIAGVPLRPSTAQNLNLIYLSKGIHATTAIEGNTLSEEEVKERIQGKKDLPPSQEYLGQEVDNVLNAYNSVLGLLREGKIFDQFTPELIKEFNQSVLDKLPLPDEVIPDNIRTHEVLVGNRYRGAPPEDCEFLLERLCQFLNEECIFPNFEPIAAGLLKAMIAHLYIAWIHPFGDGNGRTARLVEFVILLAAGAPTPAAHLLSDHYNTTRAEYYRQLDQASKSGGDVIPFIQYAMQGYVDGLKQQLSIIRKEQWDIVWQNYIHEQFKDHKSPTSIRKRYLALDISKHDDFIPISQIEELSPRLAKAYANKTDRTITRDLFDLSRMNLIERRKKSVRAKKEIILSFLPERFPQDQ